MQFFVKGHCLPVLPKFAFLLLFVLLAFPLNSHKEDTSSPFGTDPVKKNGRTKWRIGYYEGGSYGNYCKTIHGLIKAFASLGWIRNRPLASLAPEGDSKALWLWYASRLESDYIEFAADAVWSDEWNESARERNREAIFQRLNIKSDIDCMIAMGTWAGKDLACDRHKVFTMVLSTSDPVGSGIIKAPEVSSYPQVFAMNDPTRYETQLLLFHDTFQFKKLGIVYEDTKAGRSYAGLESVEKVARERNFEVVPCKCKIDLPDDEHATANVLTCHKTLVGRIDAMYVTEGPDYTPSRIRRVAEPFLQAGIPTLTQLGSIGVENGFLLSLTEGGFELSGLFNARVIAQVFRGAKPNQLSQVFHYPPSLSVNLEVAKRLHWNVPLQLLQMADEVFVDLPPLPPEPKKAP